MEATLLTDEDFEAKLEDPSLISSHEEALAIVDELNRAIASIEAQLKTYEAAAQREEPPEERRAWHRKASYALSMRLSERHVVLRRDKEIRGFQQKPQGPVKQPGEALAKQERLKAEAEARRTHAEAKRLSAAVHITEIQERTSFRRRFHDAARLNRPLRGA
jgi:hypothetical protein